MLCFWLSLPGAALVLSTTLTSQNLQAADWEKKDEELEVCKNCVSFGCKIKVLLWKFSRNESMSAVLQLKNISPSLLPASLLCYRCKKKPES